MPKVRGDGTIYQMERDKPKSKCRKWQLRVSIGKDLATGTYTPLTRVVSGTYTEAKAAIREFIDEIEHDQVRRHSKMPFGAYVDAWHEERRELVESGDLAEDTWTKEALLIRSLKLHLDHAYLYEITADVLEGVWAKLLRGESISGRPLSGTYVNGIAVCAHSIFWQATRDGHIPANPCDYAKNPAVDTEERPTLKLDAIVDLISKLDPSVATQFVPRFMVRTGVRRGEAHALRLCDVDRDNMMLHIRNGMSRNGKLKATKTKKGRRDLPLTPQVLEDIERRIDAIEKAFERVRETTGAPEPILQADTFLVCNDLGEPLMPHSSTRWWDRHRKELGMDGYSIYDLRHSYLSEMARRKTDPKVLQELAGHEKYETTANIYLHVSEDDKRKAIQNADW